MATKPLNQQFHFDSKTPIHDTLNRLLVAIEDRIKSVEALGTTLEQVVTDVQTIALQRMDDVFTPLILNAQQRLEQFGANFTAHSNTVNTTGTGSKTFFIDAAQRAGYVYADFVAIRHVGGTDVMTASVVSYDRTLGTLVVNSIVASGSGSHSDWEIRITAAPDLVHANRTDNPHAVTAAQVGAYTTGAVDSLISGVNSSVLLRANNLSDTTSAAAARTNLGLLSAATKVAGVGADNVLQLTSDALIRADVVGVPFDFGGRLTLSDQNPFMRTGVTSGQTVWYAPYRHPYIPIWDGSNVTMKRFVPNSADLHGLSLVMAGSANFPIGMYDLFATMVAGVMVLGVGPVWTALTLGADPATLRAASGALSSMWGFKVNANTMGMRTGVATTPTVPAGQATWLGTMHLHANGTCQIAFSGTGVGGVLVRLGLWNAHNRRPYVVTKTDSNAYANGLDTWRVVSSSNNNSVIITAGEDGDMPVTSGTRMVPAIPASGAAGTGTGLNVSNTPSSSFYGYHAPGTVAMSLNLKSEDRFSIRGFNQLFHVELGNSTAPPTLQAFVHQVSAWM